MAASYNILKLAPFNPILLRVVTAGGRRLRHAFTRWVYLALLIFFLLVTLAVSSVGNSSLSDYAKAASNAFSWISYVQLGMICLLAPVFCAAAITQERDSQTYNILLATPLTNAQIVLGSLLSRLYYVVALLLSGVPVFAITLMYGGVTASSIVLSFAIALSTALFTGALAIAIAVFRLGSSKTVFWFYVFNAIYLVALLLIDWIFLSPVRDPMGLPTGVHHTTWLTAIHPFLALQSVVSPTSYPTPDLGTLAGVNRFVRWYLAYPAYSYVAITTMLSLAMVIPSAIVLRRIAQRTEVSFWSLVRNIFLRGKDGRARRPRTVWVNPVAWREGVTRAGFSGRGLMRWLTIIVGLACAGVLLYVRHERWTYAGLSALQFVRYLLLGLVIVEFSVALLVAANTSASAVTKERESQTLDLLLVTPITSRYYIWGKLRGLVAFMLPFAAVPSATVLLMVVYDLIRGLHFAASGGPSPAPGVDSFWARAMFEPWVVNWETILTLPIVLTATLAWVCMAGLRLSLRWKRSMVSVLATVGILGGVMGILGVCGYSFAARIDYIGTPVSLVSPFSAICILLDPASFSKDWNGGTAYAVDAPVVARSVVFITTLAVSAGYCMVIWWIYTSMVKSFDMIIRRQHQ
jgi:ABC-type transport system involved in multi-copper enzyme maturation permease subunit